MCALELGDAADLLGVLVHLGLDGPSRLIGSAQRHLSNAFVGVVNTNISQILAAGSHTSKSSQRAGLNRGWIGDMGASRHAHAPKPQAASGLERPWAVLSWAVPATALLASFTALSEISTITWLSSTMCSRLSRTRPLWVAAKS